MINVK